jgi:hypothetical protein
MLHLWGRWVLGVFAVMHALLSWGQPIERVPNPRATYGGWVTDMAGVLSPEQKAQLNRLIDQLERDTGAEIAVVILRRTQGATPKEYATELFNRWGVGKREADNGVLLLVSLGRSARGDRNRLRDGGDSARRRCGRDFGHGGRAALPRRRHPRGGDRRAWRR